MNKIKNFTTALLFSAVSIVTSSAQACDSAGTGFHVGAALGAAQTTVKHKMKSEGTNPTGFTVKQNPYDNRADFGKAAGLFGLVLGYTADFGNGAVGGIEVSAGLDTTKIENKDARGGRGYANDGAGNAISVSDKNTTLNSKLKRSHYYGLAGRLGYKFSPSALAYVKAGIEAGKWTAEISGDVDLTYSNIGSGTQQAVLDTFKKADKKSKNNINLLLGGGLEVFLNKNVSLRGEYTYLFGPKLTVEKDTSKLTADVNNGKTLLSTFKTNQHRVQLVVSYYF